MEDIEKYGYAILDWSDLNLTEIHADLTHRLKQGEFKLAGIGQQAQLAHVIRQDKIHWLTGEESITRQYFFRLHELKNRLREHFYMSLQNIEAHYAYYQKGAFYKAHYDNFQSRNNRRISCILYLNSDWKPGDGGELHLFNDNKTVIIEPKWGTFVYFLSEKILHQVAESQTDRYSLTAWMRS